MCMPNPVIILWSTGRTVLACKWPDSGSKPECLLENGFNFNYIVTDNLTLEIHNATEEVAGQYSCAPVPLGHRTAKMCNLTVKGKILLINNYYFYFFYPPFRDSQHFHALSQTSFVSSFFFSPPPPRPIFHSTL